MGACVCNGLGVDFGGRHCLVSLGSAWRLGRGFLKIELPVGFFMALEGHRKHRRGFKGGSYPGLQVRVEIHVRQREPDWRVVVGFGYAGLGC